MNPDPATPPRPFLPSWLRWHDWLTALGIWLNSSRWENGYVVLLLGFVLVYQLASPIVLGDTDMWYHLNGGRYFWENGQVPVTPFFSFNDPERAWVNYYWGFQALVYKVHAYAGYQGLIVLRAALVFAGLVMIWRVIAGFRRAETAGLALLVLLALYVVLIDGRAYQLRPHLISYFFIPFFIYILEHRPRLVYLLPAATVVWVNTHGVEWVVGAVIGGAYLLEFLMEKRRGGGNYSKSRGYALGLLACVPALLLNPHGASLLLSPFAHPSDLTMYVREMRPLSLDALLTFATQRGQLGAQSAFAILFCFSVYAALGSLAGKRVRMPHLILLFSGFALLIRGNRFAWEWALLALPLLAAQSARLHQRPPGSHTISPARSLGLLLLLIPPVTLAQKLDLQKPYPFDTEGLPVGTLHFLKETSATGNMLIDPSLAGYAQWELAPHIRVFADMELPPFNDWDIFRVLGAYRNAEILKRLLGEHPIDYILVEMRSDPMRIIVNNLGSFAPVFFDDSAVLFAHRERQTALIASYELTEVDPFTLTAERNLSGEKTLLDERILELELAQELFPTGNRVLHALTRLLIDEKRYAEAERWADIFFKDHPKDPNSFFLKGVILENTDRCTEAIDYFERAFPVSSEEFHPALHQHIGSCSYLAKDFSRAYAHFRAGVNIYSRNEASEILYQYAFSAVIAGDPKRARMLLNAILYQTPAADQKVIERTRGLLAELDADSSLSTGLIANFFQ